MVEGRHRTVRDSCNRNSVSDHLRNVPATSAIIRIKALFYMILYRAIFKQHL